MIMYERHSGTFLRDRDSYWVDVNILLFFFHLNWLKSYPKITCILTHIRPHICSYSKSIITSIFPHYVARLFPNHFDINLIISIVVNFIRSNLFATGIKPKLTTNMNYEVWYHQFYKKIV